MAGGTGVPSLWSVFSSVPSQSPHLTTWQCLGLHPLTELRQHYSVKSSIPQIPTMEI